MNGLTPQNFTVRAGDSKVLKVTVVDHETGDAIPITDAQSITWRLARTSRADHVLEKTIGSGVTIITDQAGAGEANAGRLDIAISAADSEALDGEYYHDCLLVNAASASSTIFYGRANVGPNLT